MHDTVLLAIAIFFLFLALSYLLFNPVRKMLKDRQEKIATDIDTALADKKDAAALKAEYEAKLKNIDKEARTDFKRSPPESFEKRSKNCGRSQGRGCSDHPESERGSRAFQETCNG